MTMNQAASTGAGTGTVVTSSSGGWLRLGTIPNSMIWNGTDNIVLKVCFSGSTTPGGSINDAMYFTTTTPTKNSFILK